MVTLVAADAIGPGLALSGLLVGLVVTGRRDNEKWRRERRIDSYARVLSLSEDLINQLTRASYLGQVGVFGHLGDFDVILAETAELRSACTLAELYAGEHVYALLQAVRARLFDHVDEAVGSIDTSRLHGAVMSLQYAMRLELQHGVKARLRRRFQAD